MGQSQLAQLAHGTCRRDGEQVDEQLAHPYQDGILKNAADARQVHIRVFKTTKVIKVIKAIMVVRWSAMIILHQFGAAQRAAYGLPAIRT
jgi:hypothetical protein